MVFSSPTFLFLFLPLFLAGYYATPERNRSLWIVLGSWLFYGWWRFDFLLLLAASSLGAALAGRGIARAESHVQARRWLVAGVTLALGVLGYFKYFNFGVESLSVVFQGLGLRPLPAAQVVLPVGISFYTFQIISYIVDVYRGTTSPARSFLDVMAYVSLFPQLVAGPIVRYSEIADQFASREHSLENLCRGAERFMLGLARKVLIADAVAPLAEAAFSSSDPGFGGAWIGLLAYTVQIYFDFAAYSDMAIGLGRMMGFSLPENFRMPYHSSSITEFWRRWHMTLSAWLRDYLYVPLGGNRRGQGRTYLNLAVVMVLGGLWHGAAWTFVIWGGWHGAWLVLERFLRRTFSWRWRWQGPGKARTLIVVLLGWVFFRAETFSGAGVMVRALLQVGPLLRSQEPLIASHLAWQMSSGALVALVAGLVIALAEPMLCSVGHYHRERWTLLRSISLSILFGASLLWLLAASYSPFLYFQF
ncbi:poly(beta-D-mannuronate) O-acetylase [Alkalispirochaeta sphaeroplastigenens]|uniref:Poly(Beta-D-mannuronate) O-acetylase n=1 Tax=Alkalispirochaeta sphaeroplastigenens TaxID=1187066 RepID=A0A2S4JUU2_9SPIO|nr:MBOAT family protein [Alkalispirochaeta sphaeroplastigenens]POR03278.1 poly(beta-D-mannuronate) O-acetylase [Alkalispirochaeta sphaeroplastigenens]